ncbi:class I SAM-dependent methyltransferase [Hypericibacter sp.]|uniref:class I SAM-dependent methyltransferase n=1 Tax=Hypericibacter sp. TaxID=2705401 RepID=UPI003D6D0B5F
MTDSDKVFAGSIPGLYDRYLGPLLFEPYAQDIAQRLADVKEGRLLEIAAGTGIVTRALDRALPPKVAITATDLNQAMLDHAMTQLRSARVRWQQADALALPFKDGEFDVAVCQFGVMFFPDKRKAFQEALRVLKPRGRFLFNVWDSLEENEVSLTVTDAVAGCFPENPPQFLRRAPHGYHDVAAIRRELEAAGFGAIKVETLPKLSRASSPRDPAIGFCQGSPLRNEIEARDPKRVTEVTEIATQAVAARFGNGPISCKLQAIVVEARK